MTTTTIAATTMTPWEGEKVVLTPEGETLVGHWVEDDSSTYGRWFLHLRNEVGKKVTGFGGLTAEEASNYGLRGE